MAQAKLDLPGKVLVCGAAGGIGGTVARQLAEAGAKVLGTDRGTAPAGFDGGWVSADIATREGRTAIAKDAGEGLGGLVLAAGILDPAEWAAIDEAQAASVFAVNLFGPAFLVRDLEPKLADGASVVLVGSVAGLRASPATPFYAASKAALRNMAASLAALFQPRGIRVNTVAPGLIDTPLTARLNDELARRRGIDVSEIVAERAAAIPMGRAGSSEEVADAVLYLLSGQSSYLTGSTLTATGGVLAGSI
jgi:NAD(P)-dependent dehydrogenase (short-subunit alcohol dehydrogenase family)